MKVRYRANSDSRRFVLEVARSSSDNTCDLEQYHDNVLKIFNGDLDWLCGELADVLKKDNELVYSRLDSIDIGEQRRYKGAIQKDINGAMDVLGPKGSLIRKLYYIIMLDLKIFEYHRYHQVLLVNSRENYVRQYLQERPYLRKYAANNNAYVTDECTKKTNFFAPPVFLQREYGIEIAAGDDEGPLKAAAKVAQLYVNYLAMQEKQRQKHAHEPGFMLDNDKVFSGLDDDVDEFENLTRPMC